MKVNVKLTNPLLSPCLCVIFKCACSLHQVNKNVFKSKEGFTEKMLLQQRWWGPTTKIKFSISLLEWSDYFTVTTFDPQMTIENPLEWKTEIHNGKESEGKRKDREVKK